MESLRTSDYITTVTRHAGLAADWLVPTIGASTAVRPNEHRTESSAADPGSTDADFTTYRIGRDGRCPMSAHDAAVTTVGNAVSILNAAPTGPRFLRTASRTRR